MNKFWLTRVSLIALVLGVFALPAPNTFAAEEGWLVSFEEAKAAAAKEKKTIFMQFTGSDWCGYCIKLEKNVLSKDVFKTEAPKHFVLLKLDNPRDKSKQSDEEKAQYPKLAAQYKVTGVPMIILADEQGRPFAKLSGYGGVAADKYVEDLAKKNGIRVIRDAAFAKAAEAEGIGRAKFLDEALSSMDQELAISNYADTVKEIIGLDAENSAGLRSRYENLQKVPVVKAAIEKIARSARGAKLADNVKAYDDLISKHKLTGELLQEALFSKSFAYFLAGQASKKEATDSKDKAVSEAKSAESKDQMSRAKVLLLGAKKVAPKTALSKRIDGIIARFFKDVEVLEGTEAAPKK